MHQIQFVLDSRSRGVKDIENNTKLDIVLVRDREGAGERAIVT
jgi:hypothetical protein